MAGGGGDSKALTNKSSFVSFPSNSTLFLLFCVPADFLCRKGEEGGERETERERIGLSKKINK